MLSLKHYLKFPTFAIRGVSITREESSLILLHDWCLRDIYRNHPIIMQHNPYFQS
jgi:hypothetical protein